MQWPYRVTGPQDQAEAETASQMGSVYAVIKGGVDKRAHREEIGLPLDRVEQVIHLLVVRHQGTKDWPIRHDHL